MSRDESVRFPAKDALHEATLSKSRREFETVDK